jgi:20S proteasome alpha/beta subunit
LLLEYLSLAFYFQRYKKLTYDEISSGTITAKFTENVPKQYNIRNLSSYHIEGFRAQAGSYVFTYSGTSFPPGGVAYGSGSQPSGSFYLSGTNASKVKIEPSTASPDIYNYTIIDK